MKKPLIPFGWLPGHWGLTGMTREIAEAEYTYQHDPYETACRVIDIKIKHADTSGLIKEHDIERLNVDRLYDVIDDEQHEYKLAAIEASDETDLKHKILELDFKYKKISEEEYEFGKLELADITVTDRNIRQNELNFKYNKIGENEYAKNKATYNGEGWVNVIRIENNDGVGNFELDWNDHFIAELKQAGFKGDEDEDIVNQWFSRVCRDIALEEYSGTGDFDETLEERELVKRRKISDDKWEVK